MSKKMLINATHPEENRVAIVVDGVLSELDIEIAGREQTKGNIYKGIVVRVEPGLQAAFVDYGAERLGFLQMGEIHPSYFRAAEENGESKGRPRISDVLRRGQELLFQVVKEERGTKGAALTTYLSLPGRYMVLMPESDSKGISRKIEEESQRKALKEAMGSLDLPPDMGYIVRTAGIGQSREELKRDFDYLVRVYENILALSKQAKAPALVYKESNLVIRSIRDYFTADTDEVLVDDPKVFQEARDFFQQVMPEYAKLVKLHQERRPIFARYQIEEQIETIYRNKVALPSGGSIVIDATEALVAIDVNSGKMASEQGVEATAYKTNLEAAAEVGRQLRLRDLGGLIVIDFIDMRDRKHIRDVEKSLKDALKFDKARVTVGRISQFGLLEMSRQRIKATLAEGAYLPCPHCDGMGRVKNPESQAVAFLRKVQAGIAKGQIGRIEGEVPLDVATYLLNVKRDELQDMERRYQIEIYVQGRPDFIAGQFELTLSKRQKEEAAADSIEAVTADMTVMEPVAEETPEPVSGSEENAEEPKKKRKRRRRKKKAEGTEPETEAGAEDESSDSEPAAEPEAAEAIPEEAGEPAVDSSLEPPTEANGSAEGEEVKKKRRRRRRKKPAATEKTEAEAVDTVSAEPAAPATSAASAEPAAQHEPAAPVEPAAPAKSAPLVDSAAAPDLAEAPAAPAAKPARPRRRAPRAKAAAETASPVKTAASAEEGAKPTRTRKRAAKPAEASKTKQAETDQTAAPGEAEEKAAAKPKRRPTRAKAKAPAATTEETPKKTTRSRKSAATAEQTTETPEPKPKKRTPRKKAEAPAEAEAPATEN